MPVRYLLHGLRSSVRLVGNLRRRLRQAPDYVSFMLEGEYARIADPKLGFVKRQIFRPRPSLEELAEQFRTVAADPRVRGVLLHLRPLRLSRAGLETLRDLIGELRRAGKRVVCWSTRYDSDGYYVACAANEILLQPVGQLSALGPSNSFLFWAEALDQVGIQVDAVQISPYKSAMDRFTRTEMSREVRDMANWLLDARYDDLIGAIASGRGLTEEAARERVDRTPLTVDEAIAAGLVDGTLGEEDLPRHLGQEGRPARILTWTRARRTLLRLPLPSPGRYIGLIRIEGTIVDGRSEQKPANLPIPMLMDNRAGDVSVVQAARKALHDRRAAAVVVYVNSPGGSLTASEAMADALERLAKVKPVIVYMDGVAASGGYYVSTPAQWIVAQPGTVTGSIGILTGKLVNARLLEKLHLHREVIARGEQTQLHDSTRPFSDAERSRVFDMMKHGYDAFLSRVAKSRRMTTEQVDTVGGGRVWTGRQALERGLVDELGGLDRALARAREKAGLPEQAPVREIRPDGPLMAPDPRPTAALTYASENLRLLLNGGPLCLMPLTEWDPF